MHRALAKLLLMFAGLAACATGTEPEAYSIDPGVYAVTFTTLDPLGRPAVAYSGSARFDAIDRSGVTGSWSVPGFETTMTGAWDNDAYELTAVLQGSGAGARLRVRREGDEIACEGWVITAMLTGFGTAPAVCTMRAA